MTDTLGDRIRARRDALTALADAARAAAQTWAQNYTDAAKAAVQTYVDTQVAAVLSTAKTYVDNQIAATKTYVDQHDSALSAKIDKVVTDNSLKP